MRNGILENLHRAKALASELQKRATDGTLTVDEVTAVAIRLSKSIADLLTAIDRIDNAPHQKVALHANAWTVRGGVSSSAIDLEVSRVARTIQVPRLAPKTSN